MDRSPPDFDHLRLLLTARLGTLRSVAPLPSGSGGTSWLLETGTGRYAAKVLEPDAPVLLGPRQQFELMRRLADADIAPEPAAFDDDARLIVTEYVEDAHAVSPAELPAPSRLSAVAILLRRLHAISFDLPAFAPVDYAERYLEAIGGRALLPREDRPRFDELLTLAAEPLPGRSGLCHNDLAADNLLLGARPRLIDFDYAVLGTPVLDLASLVVMNGFDERQQEALLAAYFGSRTAVAAEEFARVLRLVRLLAHFWSLASPHAAAAIVRQYRIDDV